MKKIYSLLIAMSVVSCAMAQSLSSNIRVNQVGYFPTAMKIAIVADDAQADSFKIMTADLDSTVYRGALSTSSYYESSGENVKVADFSALNTQGTFVVVVDSLGKSYPFDINDTVFAELSKASLKAYYMQRASTPILSQYAGVYARAEGHPDTSVVVLPSAASTDRPAGTIISTPGGWYDAGDYNKYIVNSGISTFTLLSAYESFPEYFDSLKTNIPETGNGMPDILNEALWNIRWMMTMQDSDGGVYHKTTEATFSGFVMPDQVTSTRYVCAKGTGATLDFASIMAMTARIYHPYLPQLADTALAMARRAYQWALANPDVEFSNPAASGSYPHVGTGGYEDTNFSDEFSWTAAELFITTKDSTYYNAINLNGSYGLPGWADVKTLGLMSFITNRDSLNPIADTTLAEQKLVSLASSILSNMVTSPYKILGDFYYWGGNNAFANWGMIMMQAYKLTGNANYFNGALSALDYLLGRNATNYCYVTGEGSNHPMHIHHRISGSDGITEPVPGWLVGGPSTSTLTDCGSSYYPSTYSAKSYLDMQCSYSTNEIAINWNAPLVFTAGALQYIYKKNFTNSVPAFLMLSTDNIELPYVKSTGFEVAIQCNTNWMLVPSASWITVSQTTGSGNDSVVVNSDNTNPESTTRAGEIYVYAGNVLSDSIEVTQNAPRKSFRIENEDYLAMSGLQVEATSDTDGDEDLGYVDTNDWVTYSLDITNSGTYNVTFRHAGYAGKFDVYIDSVYLQGVSIPKTADWQTWASDSVKMSFSEGSHIMKFVFTGDGVNLNWMQFDWRNSVVGVDEIDNDNLRVFPVPTNKNLNLIFGNDNQSRDIKIISIDGKTLIHQTTQGISTVTIDVSQLAAGIYILQINSNSGTYTTKIIKR